MLFILIGIQFLQVPIFLMEFVTMERFGPGEETTEVWAMEPPPIEMHQYKLEQAGIGKPSKQVHYLPLGYKQMDPCGRGGTETMECWAEGQ
jgi:hypothetical protein